VFREDWFNRSHQDGFIIRLIGSADWLALALVRRHNLYDAKTNQKTKHFLNNSEEQGTASLMALIRSLLSLSADHEEDGLRAENQRLKATIVDMEVRFSELLKKCVDKEWWYKVSLAVKKKKENEKCNIQSVMQATGAQ